jgi:hypothetical protein
MIRFSSMWKLVNEFQFSPQKKRWLDDKLIAHIDDLTENNDSSQNEQTFVDWTLHNDIEEAWKQFERMA